jgi:hypothetical protein
MKVDDGAQQYLFLAFALGNTAKLPSIIAAPVDLEQTA